MPSFKHTDHGRATSLKLFPDGALVTVSATSREHAQNLDGLASIGKPERRRREPSVTGQFAPNLLPGADATVRQILVRLDDGRPVLLRLGLVVDRRGCQREHERVGELLDRLPRLLRHRID